MIRHFHFKTGLVVLVVLLAVAPVHAQTETAECRMKLADGSWSQGFEATLDECVSTLGAQIAAQTLSEVYGMWSDYYLHAQVSGAVYYAEQMLDPDWSYYGSWRLSVKELLTLVEADLNDYWSQVFAENGVDYTPIEDVVLYGGPIRSACGPTQMGNAFYCLLDHSIYLDSTLLSRQMKEIGDFAVATILAHEWGHSISWQIGYFDGAAFTIQTELQADCFAGAYASYLDSGKSQYLVLEEGDLEEGANSLFRFGDPEGGSWFDPNAHGDGEQRYAAFWNGFENGPGACEY
ncbi:MAG TPA: neutral zinc metallopeptidase [Aggregatilineaceae bacterium]|nr:neutral zinc metallopeptidase [Aggregatilineaceae bacterium]